MKLTEIVQRGWDAVGAGDFDGLIEDYVEGMKFVMPGQSDEVVSIVERKSAFDEKQGVATNE